MRKPFIAGNWKMNKTVAAAVEFVMEVRDALDLIEGVDIAFCPPYLAIPALADALQGTKIGVGAQNMYFEESGAFTGEVAPQMLTPFCKYVILGHSERRAYFGETDEGVNKKVKAALKHGLTPIVCVGESLEQNEAGETHDFVSGQVKAAFAGLSAAEMAKLVVAYEPIWAIGTGRSATVEEIATTHTSLKQTVQKPLLYGGSVKLANIKEITDIRGVDGVLVGSASLDANNFVEMILS